MLYVIILAVLCVILLIAVVISAVMLYIDKRAVDRLAEKIERFADKGELTDFSTADNRFARLENDVCDLENRLLIEKSNTRAAAKRNTEFISDVSHQLKTPLAGIRLYCEMTQNENPTAYGEKELKLIGRMEKLIYNLLRLEKLLSDSYVMDFEPQDISGMIGELLAEFHALFPTKTYELIGEGAMRCDRAWLSEAVSNLIKNASEHTPENGLIRIAIEQTERTLTLIVEDNGGGVPADELPKLFTRFHKTSNAAPDSAGIGLAITKAIVEKHHGSVAVSNGVAGLKVEMCFPLIDGNLKIEN